jgi:monoamine oxidase
MLHSIASHQHVDLVFKAINALDMGTYKKVFLSFDRIFWPPQQAMIGMVRNLNPDSHPLGNELLFDNFWARDGITSIEAVLTGSAAIWATDKDTTVIRDAVLDFMKDAMGLDTDLREWCTACHVTRWEEDRFSKGAFSYLPLGALERHREELRASEWNDKLIFAGEATISEYEGSVHAALFSARNAAESVRQYLKL